MKNNEILILLGLGAFLFFRKGGGINGVKNNDLGFGFLGNGLTVFDRNQLINGDYKTVAHISEFGDVTFYNNNNLTQASIKKIMRQSEVIKETNKEMGIKRK